MSAIFATVFFALATLAAIFFAAATFKRYGRTAISNILAYKTSHNGQSLSVKTFTYRPVKKDKLPVRADKNIFVTSKLDITKVEAANHNMTLYSDSISLCVYAA